MHLLGITHHIIEIKAVGSRRCPSDGAFLGGPGYATRACVARVA
jgi:hypothetical protein